MVQPDAEFDIAGFEPEQVVSGTTKHNGARH